LAFNAVGWMLLAVKAVAVLTVKALVVSKLALLVAGTVVFKKLMDSATDKWHGFDHGDHGLVGLPYNMEYALPSHNYHTTAELNGGDLFSMPLQQAAHDVNVQPAATHTYSEQALAPSESQLNQVITGFTAQQKSAQIQAQPLVAAQPGAKVKRQDDIWTGYLKKPMFYNGASYFQG